MKSIFSILLIIIFRCCCLGQSPRAFVITETIASDTLNKRKPSDFQRESPNFFEDDKYIVRKTCSGEFGGTVWFKNKQTGIERSCSATCPIIVNKLDGKYIVSTTLNHLTGWSQIIEIDDPEALSIFKLPKPRKVHGRTLVRYIGDDESKSIEGAKILLDTGRVSVLVNFPFNGELYYVITDYRKTYLAKIDNKRFVHIDTLSQKSFWTYETDAFKTKDGHFVVFFKNEEAEGYLDIFDYHINITRYR